MTTLTDSAPRHPLTSKVAAASRERLHPAYRPDIDGLRAVAVLSVITFHFFPHALPGGFVGVDIFFVISGYLISQIIIVGLEKNSFSLAGFYARRVRRIYPALIVVIAAALGFGWMVLLSTEYAQLGRHAAAGATFVSNLVLWSESGYFDNAAISKPLLHLWSLGVEEQFYIVWPVLLALAWRLRLNLLLVAIALALLSFGANVAVTHQSPVAAFYSPLTRWWELMVGAMLACGALHRPSQRTADTARPFRHLSDRPQVASLLSVVGIALILVSIVFVRERNFPGWQALIPTAGAALLILAGPRSRINHVILSSAPMVAIGLISYPLYLWHWPLLSFSQIIHGELGVGMRAALLVASLVLAVLTYRLIERPAKTARRRAPLTLLVCFLMAGVGGAGLLVGAGNGLEHRAVVHANASLERSVLVPFPPFTTSCSFLPIAHKDLFKCYTDTREPPRFALLGDSKASALMPGLFRTSAPGGTWMFVGSGESGPLVPVLSTSPTYAHVNGASVDIALQTIGRTKSVETVVIAVATRALFGLANDHSIGDLPKSRNYEAALNGLDTSISRLLAAGKRIVLLVDNPTLPHMRDCISRRTGSPFLDGLLKAPPRPDCEMTIARHLELSRLYRDLLDALRDRHPGKVSLFDTTPILCDGGRGVCAPSHDEHLLYGATDHISDYASRLVGRAMNVKLHPEGAARVREFSSKSRQAAD